MEYMFLTEDEQHDVLVQYHKAQEWDHYCHSVNKQRYEAILADQTIQPFLRQKTQHLLKETEDRLHEIDRYLEQTKPQLPAADKLKAATARIALKEGQSK